MINEFIGELKKIGACDDIYKVTDYKGLADLFFSSRGIEFCQLKGLSVEVARLLKNRVGEYGIYIDEHVTAYNRNAGVIGNAAADLTFSGADQVYKVIVIGGKAKIKASDYAVLQIINLGGEIDIEKDKTVVLL